MHTFHMTITETTMQNDLKEQVQLESESSKQNQEIKWIDDSFYVKKGRFLWNSYDKENKVIISSLNEEGCIKATRFYLKGKQEGFSDSSSYEGVVGGKL